MPLPQRKNMRIPDYDYGQEGAYFVTICTHDRKNLFGRTEEKSLAHQLVDRAFRETLAAFPNIQCTKYVIMPNHFHGLIVVEAHGNAGEDIKSFVQAFKSRTTVYYIKQVKNGMLPPFEGKIWQRSYYDHVVRNEQDYLEIWQYIDNNPLKWDLDRYYSP